jgi:hypothetical protein
MSGGPVVTDSGELVAIVANAAGEAESETRTGRGPRPLFALPYWLVDSLPRD